MVGRVMGLMMLGCVLGSTGCRKAERTPIAERPGVVASQTKTPTAKTLTVKTPITKEATATTSPVREASPVAIQAMPEAAPVRTSAPAEAGGPIALQESATRTRQAAPGRQATEDSDRVWLNESAEAARAGNANIDADAEAEHITIASGTVDGRVKRVRGRTIEVRDGEGNIYELRIDRRSRGLRQGRKVALKNIAQGTPVRASFDLVGGGDTLARDIVLRR